MQKLVSLVGPAHARSLLYTGGRIDATEAQRIGLVNRVVADEDLNVTVVDFARQIAENAPLSVRAAKISVDQAMKPESERDTQAVQEVVAACFDSADYREGRRAFLEKRTPVFQGR